MVLPIHNSLSIYCTSKTAVSVVEEIGTVYATVIVAIDSSEISM